MGTRKYTTRITYKIAEFYENFIKLRFRSQSSWIPTFPTPFINGFVTNSVTCNDFVFFSKMLETRDT